MRKLKTLQARTRWEFLKISFGFAAGMDRLATVSASDAFAQPTLQVPLVNTTDWTSPGGVTSSCQALEIEDD